MKKLVTVLFGAAVLLAPVASAYSIKHSYSAAGNATEYHGSCASGDRILVVEQSNGSWKYEGPAGDGTVKAGNLDLVAKKACGEN